MADISPNEDDALRYVLGELNNAERREFESRMAGSAELRVLVGELEAGVVATANAAPRRRVPAEIWRRIEKAMVKETRPKLVWPSFGLVWLRNGWAVAAVCLIGWLFYAFSVNRQTASAPEKLEISRPEVTVASPLEPLPKPVATKPLIASVTNTALELLQARTREVMELRGKIAQLETARTQLSLSLAQQHALLGESNRIKFYHLSPASTAGATPNAAPLSPGLQRAVFMALARELGWLPATPSAGAQAGGNVPPTPTTIGGVDFIDLHPASQNVASQPQAQPQQAGSGQTATDNNTTAATPVQPQPQPQTESAAVAQETTASDPAIPAYVSGDNLVVALDSTVVPMGSLVMLTAYDANQNQTGGNFVLGNNPAVVTVPLPSNYYTAFFVTGFGVSLSFTSPNGQLGTIYFSLPSSLPSP